MVLCAGMVLCTVLMVSDGFLWLGCSSRAVPCHSTQRWPKETNFLAFFLLLLNSPLNSNHFECTKMGFETHSPFTILSGAMPSPPPPSPLCSLCGFWGLKAN